MSAETTICFAIWGMSLILALMLGCANLLYNREQDYQHLLNCLQEILNLNDGQVTAQQLVFKSKAKPDAAISFLRKIAKELNAETVVEEDSQNLIYTFRHYSTISNSGNRN